jgi:hypothetical protein
MKGSEIRWKAWCRESWPKRNKENKGMRYADLKKERDDAIARAVEAERLSMKSEFDRVVEECEREKARLLDLASSDKVAAYRQGVLDGLKTLSVETKGAIDLLIKKIELALSNSGHTDDDILIERSQ